LDLVFGQQTFGQIRNAEFRTQLGDPFSQSPINILFGGGARRLPSTQFDFSRKGDSK
jgi:hypothetical protein